MGSNAKQSGAISTRRRLFYSASSLSVLQIIEIVISFLLMPVMIAELGKQQYGIWILIYTISFYLGFLNVGLASSVQRYLSIAVGNRDNDEFNRVASSSFFIFVFLSILLLPAVFLISHYGGLITDAESTEKFSSVILIIGMKVILLIPGITFMAVLVAKIRQDLQGLVEILTAVLRAVGMYIVLKTNADIISLAWVVLIIETLGRGGIVYFAYKICPYLSIGRRFYSAQTAKSIVVFSIQAVLVWLGTRIRDSAHNFIISINLGVSNIVVISVPFMLITYAHQFVTLLISPLTPLLTHNYSRENFPDFSRLLDIKCDIALCVSGIILIEVVLLGNDFISIWLKGLVDMPTRIFFALGLFMFILSSQRPLYNYLTITNQQIKLMILTYIEAFIVVILEIILIDYGLEAMIWGLVIPTLLLRGIVLPVICHKSMSAIGVNPGHVIYRPTLIAIAIIMVNYYVNLDQLLSATNWLQLILYGVLTFIVALLLCYPVINKVTRSYLLDEYRKRTARSSI